MLSFVDAGATFDPARVYRYHLWRHWAPGPRVLWVMLNPSTADEHVLDPTLRRCEGFTRAWGYNGFEVVNLFALRSTDPSALRHPERDPVGAANDAAIVAAAQDHQIDRIVCGWGRHGRLLGRDHVVRHLLRGYVLHALGRNADGSPVHPLYQPSHRLPVAFR